MKKVCFILFGVAILISCENLIVDLPKTDTASYINENTVTFPQGTRAIDIYNTVASLYNDNEYHNVNNGSWKYIKTTNIDGLTNQVWETVPFSKIRHIYIKSDPEINTHTVYLWTNETSIKEIVFKWQRQTTNAWENNAIEGDIVFHIQ